LFHFFCCLFLAVHSFADSIEGNSTAKRVHFIVSGFVFDAACPRTNVAGLSVDTGAVELIELSQTFSISAKVSLASLVMVAVYVGSCFAHFIALPFPVPEVPFLVGGMVRR
jgi:hypothetical protein